MSLPSQNLLYGLEFLSVCTVSISSILENPGDAFLQGGLQTTPILNNQSLIVMTLITTLASNF